MTDATDDAGGEDVDERIARLEDSWRRALADRDNLQKRVARDIERANAAERARVAAVLLPILDNLDLALAHSFDDDAQADGVMRGIRAVRDQALAILARLGYPRHDDLGVPFDPSRHEAISTVPAVDAPEGSVVAVVRPRYGDGDHLLRPAGVVVATRPQ
jgi:molecular chaperone GrpE